MASGEGPPERLRAVPNEHPAKLLGVALGVCLVCSTLVAGSVVLLRPIQARNLERHRQQQVQRIVAELPGLGDVLAGLQAIEVEAVAVPVAGAAGADAPVVHLVRREGRIEMVILPVSGPGFASTMRGYLALDGDGETVRALTFYEHGETPGIGSEIENPAWQALWAGKRVRDEEGALRLRVADGAVAPGSPAAAFEVDAITGATYTSQGVTDLVRSWLGPDGFGPYLQSLREREAGP